MRQKTTLSNSSLGLIVALLATGASAESMPSLTAGFASAQAATKAASAQMKEISANAGDRPQLEPQVLNGATVYDSQDKATAAMEAVAKKLRDRGYAVLETVTNTYGEGNFRYHVTFLSATKIQGTGGQIDYATPEEAAAAMAAFTKNLTGANCLVLDSYLTTMTYPKTTYGFYVYFIAPLLP